MERVRKYIDHMGLYAAALLKWIVVGGLVGGAGLTGTVSFIISGTQGIVSAIIRIEIQIKDGAQLSTLMNKLHQISGVLQVNRPVG